MASSQHTVEYLPDQLFGAGQASARNMFGKYCLYLAGKLVQDCKPGVENDK
jgi:TfoX/Sxy family transcriptional regulator of competence genes